MKEKTRESVFSLVGGKLPGFLAVDLFGGTGILGLESISRGAEQAVILELARNAFRSILKSVEELELGEKVKIHHVDSLRWMRDAERNIVDWPKDLAWVVFCCPPYRMWTQETDKLVAGLSQLWEFAPAGSFLVCETEASFDLPQVLPELDWDVRRYNPAHIAVTRKAPNTD